MNRKIRRQTARAENAFRPRASREFRKALKKQVARLIIRRNNNWWRRDENLERLGSSLLRRNERLNVYSNRWRSGEKKDWEARNTVTP